MLLGFPKMCTLLDELDEELLALKNRKPPPFEACCSIAIEEKYRTHPKSDTFISNSTLQHNFSFSKFRAKFSQKISSFRFILSSLLLLNGNIFPYVKFTVLPIDSINLKFTKKRLCLQMKPLFFRRCSNRSLKETKGEKHTLSTR